MSVPSGCAITLTAPSALGGGSASVTSASPRAGSWVAQFAGSASAARSSAAASTCGAGGSDFGVPHVSSKSTSLSHQRTENFAGAGGVPDLIRVAVEHDLDRDRHQRVAAPADLDVAVDVDAEAAVVVGDRVEAERRRRCPPGRCSARSVNSAPSCQLDAVIAAYACSVSTTESPIFQTQAEPIDPRRQRGRQVGERRMEAAGRDREGGVAADADPHDQRAAELDAAQLRVAQPRVDREQPGLDVVVAEEIGGEVDEPRRVDRRGRRRRPDRPDHGQPGEAEVPAAERAGELREDRQARDDERRRRPS